MSSSKSNFSAGRDLVAGLCGEDSISAEDMFNYVYAILHSPTYRSRYGSELRKEFPRIPLTSRCSLFAELSHIGSRIVSLHLLESPKLDEVQTIYVGLRNPTVEKISYTNETVWLDKQRTSGFRSVPDEVWSFYIGGYQVCDKWLKDRKGCTLSTDDIAHYHKIVLAILETISLMTEIDKAIDAQGGWPNAFTQVTG